MQVLGGGHMTAMPIRGWLVPSACRRRPWAWPAAPRPARTGFSVGVKLRAVGRGGRQYSRICSGSLRDLHRALHHHEFDLSLRAGCHVAPAGCKGLAGRRRRPGFGRCGCRARCGGGGDVGCARQLRAWCGLWSTRHQPQRLAAGVGGLAVRRPCLRCGTAKRRVGAGDRHAKARHGETSSHSRPVPRHGATGKRKVEGSSAIRAHLLPWEGVSRCFSGCCLVVMMVRREEGCCSLLLHPPLHEREGTRRHRPPALPVPPVQHAGFRRSFRELSGGFAGRGEAAAGSAPHLQPPRGTCTRPSTCRSGAWTGTK